MSVTIGYIVGSLSSASINRQVLNALIALAPQDVTFTEISIDALPLYSPDHDADMPPVARNLKAGVEDADVVIVATPQYNDSYSGVAKNAIDWASRPWGQHSFAGKPTAVTTASIAPHGGAKAGALLRDILEFGTANVMERQLNVHVGEGTFDENGDPASEELRAEFEQFLDAVITHAAAQPATV